DPDVLDDPAAVVRVGATEGHTDEPLCQTLPPGTVDGSRPVDRQATPVAELPVVPVDVVRAGHDDRLRRGARGVDPRAAEENQRGCVEWSTGRAREFLPTTSAPGWIVTVTPGWTNAKQSTSTRHPVVQAWLMFRVPATVVRVVQLSPPRPNPGFDTQGIPESPSHRPRVTIAQADERGLAHKVCEQQGYSPFAPTSHAPVVSIRPPPLRNESRRDR